MLTISVPARLEQLNTINAFLKESIPEEFASLLPNIRLITEELLVNVFNYAYEDGEGMATLCLRKEMKGGKPCLRLTIADQGTHFNPFSDAKSPDCSLSIPDRPIGGLGIHLVRTLTDSQEYHYEDSSNITDVWFPLPPKKTDSK